MSEVDLYVRFLCEFLVLSHLSSLVVGKGFLEMFWKFSEGVLKGFPDASGIFLFKRNNHEVSGCSFNKRANGALETLSHYEISFPMAGNKAVLYFIRTLVNENHIWVLPPFFFAFRDTGALGSPSLPVLAETLDETGF